MLMHHTDLECWVYYPMGEAEQYLSNKADEPLHVMGTKRIHKYPGHPAEASVQCQHASFILAGADWPPCSHQSQPPPQLSTFHPHSVSKSHTLETAIDLGQTKQRWGQVIEDEKHPEYSIPHWGKTAMSKLSMKNDECHELPDLKNELNSCTYNNNYKQLSTITGRLLQLLLESENWRQSRNPAWMQIPRKASRK